MKVISYVIDSDDDIGALMASIEAYKALLPDYGIYVYHKEDIQVGGINTIRIEDDDMTPLCRLMPMNIEGITHILPRDIGHIPTHREIDLIHEWEATGKELLVMRDLLMPDMYGIHRVDIPTTTGYEYQEFMDKALYPMCSRLVYDSYHRYLDEDMVSVPPIRDIVPTPPSDGQDRYLWFWSPVDYLHTEQFGGFFYMFMEMISIARSMDRILVLPNVHVAPRDSAKCEADPSQIYIDRLESRDIRDFIDIDILGRYVRYISLPDFMRMLSTKDMGTDVVVQEGKEGRLYTPSGGHTYLSTMFGHVRVANRYRHNVPMIGVSQLLSRSDMQDRLGPVVTICNYGRSNQLFIMDPRYEYKHIRKMINFPLRLVEQAESLYQEAIGVHWRRGDYVTTQYQHESDTRRFYDHIINKGSKEHLVDTILKHSKPGDRVLLIHNSGSSSDIEYIVDHLPDRQVVPYTGDPMVSMILLAMCSKQIHFSGSSYLRMSNFGRIAIEEAHRYHREEPTIVYMS